MDVKRLNSESLTLEYFNQNKYHLNHLREVNQLKVSKWKKLTPVNFYSSFSSFKPITFLHIRMSRKSIYMTTAR